MHYTLLSVTLSAYNWLDIEIVLRLVVNPST